MLTSGHVRVPIQAPLLSPPAPRAVSPENHLIHAELEIRRQRAEDARLVIGAPLAEADSAVWSMHVLVDCGRGECLQGPPRSQAGLQLRGRRHAPVMQRGAAGLEPAATAARCEFSSTPANLKVPVSIHLAMHALSAGPVIVHMHYHVIVHWPCRERSAQHNAVLRGTRWQQCWIHMEYADIRAIC